MLEAICSKSSIRNTVDMGSEEVEYCSRKNVDRVVTSGLG